MCLMILIIQLDQSAERKNSAQWNLMHFVVEFSSTFSGDRLRLHSLNR